MSKYILLSFGLISFLFFTSFISCASLSHPTSYSKSDDYSPSITSEEGDIRFISPNRYLRSSVNYPRANRNQWFRVATYQHFKPSGMDETPNADHLMRWG